MYCITKYNVRSYTEKNKSENERQVESEAYIGTWHEVMPKLEKRRY